MHPQILIPIVFVLCLASGAAGFVLKSRLLAAADGLKSSAMNAEKKAADKLESIRKKI